LPIAGPKTEQAFARPRNYALNRNLRLGDVAKQVVDGSLPAPGLVGNSGESDRDARGHWPLREELVHDAGTIRPDTRINRSRRRL
jgi:hypothetical protein